MDLNLKILNYGGDYSYITIKLPIGGYLCETSYGNLGNDYVTGYLFACKDTKENEKHFSNSINYNCYVCKYPGYFIIFIDRCKIKNLDEVVNNGECSLCDIDKFNSLFAFDKYWVVRENFKHIRFSDLVNKFGDDVTKYEHVISYNKVLGFSGDSNHVKCLTVYNENIMEIDKKIDMITKQFLCFDSFDLFESHKYCGDKIKWLLNDDIFTKVQNRINEILNTH